MIRLRWAFYFIGGGERHGGWNSQTPNLIDSPKTVDLTGLVHAVIESKDEKYQVRTLASCSAKEFIEFQTMMLAPMKNLFFKGRMQLPGKFAGLRIVTKTGYTEVFINGKTKNTIAGQ